MPCLLALVGLIMPRVVLLAMAICTNWIGQAMSGGWAFLGFMFMPYTTLLYIAAMLNNNHEVTGGWFVAIVVAVLLDLGGDFSTAASKKKS